MLVPLILGNIRSFEPGTGERRFEQGRQEAWKKEQELLERLRALPDAAPGAHVGWRAASKAGEGGLTSGFFLSQAGAAQGWPEARPSSSSCQTSAGLRNS